MNRKTQSKKSKGTKSHAGTNKPMHNQDAKHEAMLASAMTFAEMLQAQPAIRRQLKLPPWLAFKLPYARKDQASLTENERQRFLCAFNVINSNGTLGALVDIHGDPVHQPHSTQRFLPWHRIYLLRMEELLMMADPTVCIPYWKSSEEQAFPAWLLGFTPTVNLAGGPHTVTRNIGAFAVLPDAAAVAAVMANGTFNAFTPALQGVHNSGHVWVGGSMGSVPTAPADPVFWMHHAESDRIWAAWQATHPGQNPTLAGAAATMDPWTETEPDTRDITVLGYAYA